MLINTANTEQVKKIIQKIQTPNVNSHKGQNGKLLVIGGSSLFHAASLWAAEISSHIVDMVHYASTEENNNIFENLKSKFTNGIVVPQKSILDYAAEDDCILIGPGMLRGDSDEAKYTHDITKQLIEKFPDKKFVFDAGALQMMDKSWLLNLKTKPIITPHKQEFISMFGDVDVSADNVSAIANQYKCVIILKNISDIVSNGENVMEIVGGNAGLTKGGTGDVLAGLIASLNTKNNQLDSAVAASILLKKSAEILATENGNWYNTEDLIKQIPKTFNSLQK